MLIDVGENNPTELYYMHKIIHDHKYVKTVFCEIERKHFKKTILSYI